MADLLAELEGFLDKDTVAKIRANPTAVARVARASEVLSFYDGDTETPPAPPARREPPPPATGAPSPDSLSAIMARLDSFSSTLDDKIKTGVEAVVNSRGAELRGGAVADSIKITRELSKLDARHRADFNEDLDDAKLEAHIAAAREAGRPFRTVTDAYEDMTKTARTEKIVTTAREEGAREALKNRASGNVPGASPSAGATPMLRMLRKAPTSGEGGGHLDAAARALEQRLMDRGEQVA